MQTGYPGWSEFLLQQSPPDVKKKVSTHIHKGRFEEAAELIEETRGFAFQNAIESEFYSSRELEASSAVFCLPRLVDSYVITTNFDNVLERAFEVAHRPFERVALGVYGDDVYDALQANRRSLIKIHGKATSAATRILTHSEYMKHYCHLRKRKIDYSKQLPRALRTLVTDSVLLFIGCSLQNDRYLKVLKAAVADCDIWHFAIVAEPPATLAHTGYLDERVNELEAFHIHPIWYPSGSFDSIKTILEHIATSTSRDPLAYLCPAHKRPNDPLTYNLPVSLAEEGLDFLALIRDSVVCGGELEVLAGTPFSELSPGYVGGGPRVCRLSRRGAAVEAEFFPHAFDAAKRPVDRIAISPSDSPQTLTYWPNGHRNPHRFRISFRADRVSEVTISTLSGTRIHQLTLIINQKENT